MKKIGILFSILILCAFSMSAQTNRDTKKIKKFYDKREYRKVVDYKPKRDHKLDGEGLFYKGVSAYRLDETKKANEYLQMSVAKDSSSSNAYYYKGLTEYEMEKNSEAIASFSKAISLDDSIPDYYSYKGEAYLALNQMDSAMVYLRKAIDYPDCDVYNYSFLAYAFQMIEQRDSAVYYYDYALKLTEPGDDMHEVAMYNKGLMYFLMKDYQKSIDVFKEYVEVYPEDYQAMSKYIQAIVGQGETDEHLALIEKLYKAKDNAELPEDISDMFCFDQFNWREYLVFGFELYEKEKNPMGLCKHVYLAALSNGKVAFMINSARESASTNLRQLKMLRNDTLYVYPSFEYVGNNYYKELTNSVIKVLNNEIKPDTVIANYESWLKAAAAEKLAALENDGSSYEKAIKVQSVSEEYEWLGLYYPGYTMIRQVLAFENKTPYDILKFEFDGVEKEIYFDISSFFGKELK